MDQLPQPICLQYAMADGLAAIIGLAWILGLAANHASAALTGKVSAWVVKKQKGHRALLENSMKDLEARSKGKKVV